MDIKDINTQNLLFLLSAAPLSVGCVITGDDTDTEAATTAPTTSTTGSTTETPTSSTTETPTSSTTETPTSSTTEGPMDTTEGPMDTTDGTTTTSKGTPCEGYATVYTTCYKDSVFEDEVAFCEDYTAYLDGLGVDGCVAAWEEYLNCLSGLDCKAFEMQPPTDEPKPDPATCLGMNDFVSICFPE